MLQAGKAVWIKTVQERTKNASYESSHIPEAVTALRASKVCDECRLVPFISINKYKDGGSQGLPLYPS